MLRSTRRRYPPATHGPHAGSNGAAANGQQAEELTDEQIFWGGKTVQDGGRTIYGSVWPKVRLAPLQDMRAKSAAPRTYGSQCAMHCTSVSLPSRLREGCDGASPNCQPSSCTPLPQLMIQVLGCRTGQRHKWLRRGCSTVSMMGPSRPWWMRRNLLERRLYQMQWTIC